MGLDQAPHGVDFLQLRGCRRFATAGRRRRAGVERAAENLDQNRRSAGSQQLDRAGQHFLLEAFDVDLEQRDALEAEAVQWAQFHAIAAAADARAAFGGGRHRIHLDDARVRAEGVAQRHDDILEAVQRDVVDELAVDLALRLEGVDLAAAADQPRHQQRVGADVGADVQRDRPRPHMVFQGGNDLRLPDHASDMPSLDDVERRPLDPEAAHVRRREPVAPAGEEGAHLPAPRRHVVRLVLVEGKGIDVGRDLVFVVQQMRRQVDLRQRRRILDRRLPATALQAADDCHGADSRRNARSSGWRHAKPLGFMLAEGRGFEPREGLPSLVFKTSAFGRSATPP